MTEKKRVFQSSKGTINKPFFMNVDNKNYIRPNPKERTFQCAECSASFSYKSDIIVHMSTHTKGNPLQCSECDKVYNKKGSLKAHMRFHTGETPYQCSVCLKSFTFKGNLERHMKIHRGHKPFKCLECNKSFSRKGDLKIHERSHTGERPHHCSVCSKSYTCSSGLTKHVKRTGCNNLLSSGHGHEDHKKISVRERPFQCAECKSSFFHKSDLSVHIRTHTGERPFQCCECHKAFIIMHDLNNHIRTHTGERPFHCKECNKYFSVKSHLRRHTRSKSHHKRTVTNRKQLKNTVKFGVNEKYKLQCLDGSNVHLQFSNLKSHVNIHRKTNTSHSSEFDVLCDSKNELNRRSVVERRQNSSFDDLKEVEKTGGVARNSCQRKTKCPSNISNKDAREDSTVLVDQNNIEKVKMENTDISVKMEDGDETDFMLCNLKVPEKTVYEFSVKLEISETECIDVKEEEI